ncbi:MAG: valine--tRNA ligase [Pyrinomonadaceae bacterium]
MDLAKQYNPKEAEEGHYQRWEESGCFKPETNQNPDAGKYSIVIPPPNVTGSLHMGHALQHTIMDVLTRRKRMLGFRTLFVPGIDHAGISTQKMVTDKLWAEEQKTPLDIGREAFTEKVWAWKEKYGGTILSQIRREGISVDWSREHFTMDEDLSKAVRNVFVTLYEEGWIYRGARIVNWCPNDRTVLSDLEVEDETKKDGKLYYLQYPVKGADLKLTVATTRPETMLGDTAVAVNPNDERFRDLIGKTVDLPLTGREIPVIADEYVDMEFGTGAVKITPAHDPNDYEMGLRHQLEELNVMNLDGTMNEAAGADFDRLDRYEARRKVVEKFRELGLLEKIDDHEMVLPVCARCKTVIETLVSEQWWVKMDEMRDLALKLKRETDYPRFTPHNPNTKVYTDWLENLRDWTISRQLWWGHQIPAWYDESGEVYVARSAEEAARKAGTDKLTQDPDVLDTWFSSWLWSFSTLGWDGETTETEDLRRYHPTDVLVTARDIIFLWVSRMVMAALKFVGERPFDDVYITGTVLAKDGQRMSKTKKNGVDPIEVFDKYGVDATRITLAGSSTGMDFAWRDEKVESYRNFANKIWNATRFCLLNSEGARVDPKSLSDPESIADKWIISRLNKTARDVNDALEKYAFHEAVQLLYHFFWDDFCDWYIELVKDEISDGDQSEPQAVAGGSDPKSAARTRIISILEQALRLLHPFMPYLTEDLWQKLPGVSSDLHNPAYASAPATVMLADFPKGEEALIDERAESEMGLVIELITRIRNIRAEMRIKASEKLDVHVSADDSGQRIFAENEAQILKLARAGRLHLGDGLNVPKASAKGVMTSGAEIAVPLEGLIDFEMERERLSAQINNLKTEGDKLGKQLSNENFVQKAPPEKVEAVRERMSEIETQLKALKENLEVLG